MDFSQVEKFKKQVHLWLCPGEYLFSSSWAWLLFPFLLFYFLNSAIELLVSAFVLVYHNFNSLVHYSHIEGRNSRPFMHMGFADLILLSLLSRYNILNVLEK